MMSLWLFLGVLSDDGAGKYWFIGLWFDSLGCAGGRAVISLWMGPSDCPYKSHSSINTQSEPEHPITQCAVSDTWPF